MKRGHGNGFTLVELLVVVALITLLAALLLPMSMYSRTGRWEAAPVP